MPAGPRHRRASLRFWPVWWATFLSFVAVGVVWNLAQPLLSGADEPVHFLEAEAVWAGQLVPKVVPEATLPMDVGVLHVRALSHDDVDCYNHHLDRPASCAGGTFRVSPRAETTTSYIAREPPLPAFLNGLPVFLDPGPAGLVMGRILDAVISSAALATALAYAAVRRRPFLAVGIVVAFTPEALAETGVLGSSQLEIAAALLVWTLVALLLDGERPTRRFVALLTVSAAVLALARPISFVWLALAGLTLLVGLHRRRLVALLRAPAVRVGLPVVAAVLVVALGWYLFATAPDNPAFPKRVHLPATTLGDLSVVLRGVRTDWLQMLGQTGGDYSGPWWMALLWTALIGLVVGLGLLWSSRRRVIVVVGLIVVFFALPTVVKTVELPHLWLFWHGRYDIPTLSGVVIVAAAALDRAAGRVSELGRLPTAVVTLAGLAQMAEFVGALRRFAVGEDGSLNPLTWYRGWHPPIPAVVLLPLGVVVIAIAYGVVRGVQRSVLIDRRARSDPPPGRHGPPAGRHGPPAAAPR